MARRQILGPRGETGYPFRKGATRDIRLPRAHRDPRSRRLPRPRRRIRCRPQGAGLGQGMAGPDGQREVRGKLEWRSTLFKTAITKADWEKAIRATRAPLGALKSRTLKS